MVLLLTRKDLESVMDMKVCLGAVQERPAGRNVSPKQTPCRSTENQKGSGEQDTSYLVSP
jgi:hypothetical protein